jgi:endonuclease/exonuclease/phosphatase family metal-dependent hydrolase
MPPRSSRSTGSGATVAPGPFRVLTINTGKCDGPYRARLGALLTSIRGLRPDLVLAQEVFEGVEGGPVSDLSTARWLAAGLEMESAFHPIRRKPREAEGVWGDSYSGLATLSRWPIRDVVPLPLPDDPDDGDRAGLFVAVETPAGVVRSANTHLTHLRHRDDLRVQQAGTLAADAWWEGVSVARLIGGDLNARPEHAVHGLLRTTGFVDAFVAADATAPATLRRETPDGFIETRLDYLYLRSGVRDSLPRVPSARVVLDEPIDGTMPSDHFGVMADILLDRGQATA